MKKILSIIVLLVSITSLMSCSKVPAGSVGIKFYLLGQSKGVDYDVLTPGRYWIGVNEELFLFPTRIQNRVWTSDVQEGSPHDESFEFQSKEGMKLTANVGLDYYITKENAPKIFELYKTGCDEITNVVLRNIVRDAFNAAASSRTAENMYGEGKVKFLEDVKELVKRKSIEKYITVNDLYLLGNMGVPAEVTKALNAKITANQKAEQAENELRQAEAEARKVEAIAQGNANARIIEAEAEAEANRKLSASITQTLVEYEKVKKWDGKQPQVTGGNAIVSLK